MFKRSSFGWLLVCFTTLLALVALAGPGWADSCGTVTLTSSPQSCTIPEATPEVSATVTLSNASIAVGAEGIIELLDPTTGTPLSDVVAFANVGGAATITFASDTDLLTLPGVTGLPVIGTLTEGKTPISFSIALSGGGFLSGVICSDLTESPTDCSGSSDSISFEQTSSVVPEPAPLLLLGSGLLGMAGVVRLRLKARSS